MELSPRQREIIEFVNQHVDQYGYPPTVREIGQAVGSDVARRPCTRTWRGWKTRG